MPPSAELDPAKFLRERGITPRSQTGAPPPPPTAAPAAPNAPSLGPPSAQAAPPAAPPAEADFRPSARHAQEWRGNFSQGFQRGATRFGLAASDLASSAAPQAKEWLKQSFPSLSGYAKSAREFTAQKPGGTAESMGETAGEIAPAMLMRIPGLGKVASRAILSSSRPAVPQFVRGVGWVGQQGMPPRAARTAAKWTRHGVDAAQTAAGGAAGGAVADPENPTRGAATGALAGFAGQAAGSALKTPLGKFAGSLAAAEGTYEAAHRLTGLSFHPFLGPMIVWSSFMGRPLRRFGSNLFDHTGRLITKLNPAMTGYLASKAADGADVSGAIAEFYREFVPQQPQAQEGPPTSKFDLQDKDYPPNAQEPRP